MKMRYSTTELPDEYEQIYVVNLQKDKKLALLVNAIGVAVVVIMFVIMNLIIPFSTLLGFVSGITTYIVRMAVLIVGVVLYIILHELTHAVVMKYYGAKKVRFGFTGLYAYAGSEEDYFNKRSYICIALAPLIIWGVIFSVLCVLVPTEWFWIVYLWQVMNVSGAAGDIFVTIRFSKMPKDILVKDTGVEMKVYSKEN